jgi:YD repeat-containing protein
VNGTSVKVSTNDGTLSIPAVPVSEGTNSVSGAVEDLSGNVSSQTVGFTKGTVEKTEWLTYDNNGNLLSVTSAASVVQYSWDMENRLTKVTSNGVTILE